MTSPIIKDNGIVYLKSQYYTVDENNIPNLKQEYNNILYTSDNPIEYQIDGTKYRIINDKTQISEEFKGNTQIDYNYVTTLITDMSQCFTYCESFNRDISTWDVQYVTTMKIMFYDATNFNQDISNWNVGNVINMLGMFIRATNFNQPLNSWNVSNVTNMGSMFTLTSFNQDISNWDVSKVTNMQYMFTSATNFNQPLNIWNVQNVTDMQYMFASATNFNQDISNWNVSKVTDMTYMFTSATNFNQDISNWNVSNVTSMIGMFYYALVFNQNIRMLNTNNVLDYTYMFTNATQMRTTYIGVDGFEDTPTSSFFNQSYMYNGIKYTKPVIKRMTSNYTETNTNTNYSFQFKIVNDISQNVSVSLKNPNWLSMSYDENTNSYTLNGQTNTANTYTVTIESYIQGHENVTDAIYTYSFNLNVKNTTSSTNTTYASSLNLSNRLLFGRTYIQSTQSTQSTKIKTQSQSKLNPSQKTTQTIIISSEQHSTFNVNDVTGEQVKFELHNGQTVLFTHVPSIKKIKFSCNVNNDIKTYNILQINDKTSQTFINNTLKKWLTTDLKDNNGNNIKDNNGNNRKILEIVKGGSKFNEIENFTILENDEFRAYGHYFIFNSVLLEIDPTIDVCLLEGTIIDTDQGKIPIERINKSFTIKNYKIKVITKGLFSSNTMVKIKKDTFSINVPNKDTYITPCHSLYLNGKFVLAGRLVDKIKGISFETMAEKPKVYNILFDKWLVINANGLPVESLHPNYQNKVFL